MNTVLTEELISTNTESTILRDSILTGFGVRIYPSGKTSYFIDPTINGKSKRKVIGKYPDLSVADARIIGESRIAELTSDTLATVGNVIKLWEVQRTFGSYTSEAGCAYLLIKKALNHSVSEITARYIQASPKTLSPVFEALAELIAENR